MSLTNTLNYRPSLGDRISIMVFMLFGAVLAVAQGIGSAQEIATAAAGGPVEADVSFIDTTAQVAVGASATPVTMDIDTATVTADHLTGIALGTAIASSLIGFLVTAGIVGCLIALAANSLRGRIFTRGNTRLVIGAGMTALVGFGMQSVLDRMVGNEILLQTNPDALDSIAVWAADPLPFLMLAFAFGIVATAYTIGVRLQGETEGLI